MIRTNLTRFSALAFATLLSVGATAQTAIWGVGSTTGVAHGEFQTPITTSTTGAPYVDTVWTAVSINEDGGTVSPGSAFWENRSISRGAYGAVTCTSPSAANGAALFDSDFLDNAGVQGAFGTGTSPSTHQGILVSPRIDLTGYTNTPLTVDFYAQWRNYSTNFTVSLSVDDGLTWTDVDMQTLLPAVSNASAKDSVSAAFYNITTGVANLTQCRIRFVFDGEYYYTFVDDISIKTAQRYDLAIALPDVNGGNLPAVYTQCRIGNNRYIPAANLVNSPNELREFQWGFKVVNHGYANVLPADGPRMRVNIDFVDALTGITTTGVYSDTMAIMDTIVSKDVNGVVNTKLLRDINFIDKEGDYVVTYWVEFDSTDTNYNNDTTTHTFTLTGYDIPMKNYISKAKLAADGKVFSSSRVFPGGGGSFSDFEYGSMYFFPRGATDSFQIDSVDFRYFVPSSFTGTSQTLAVNVYQWTDATSGAQADGLLDEQGAELLHIGTQLSTIRNFTTNDYGLSTVSSFVDPATGSPLGTLADGGFYLVTIQNLASYNGVASFTSSDAFFFGTDTRINYAINVSTSSAAVPVALPSPVKVLDGAGAGKWNRIGFGADMVPSIGIYMSVGPTIVGTTVYETEGVAFAVYPNPTTDIINVSLDLDEAQDVTYILTNVSGQVLSMSKAQNITTSNYTVDVTAFPAGVYFLTAKTAKGESTQRFVKK